MNTTDFRDAVRREIQDGAASYNSSAYNVVRLEDLTDQIVPQATPTGTQFLIRFDGVPFQGYVPVFVVPGSLAAYRDNSPSPDTVANGGVTVDTDANGNFTLLHPPTSMLKVSYGWQLFQDRDVEGFVDEGRAWLRDYSAVSDIPDGLTGACTEFASARALRAMARKATLADMRAGAAEAAFGKLADSYTKQADALEKLAATHRDDYYKRAGEQLAPAVDSIAGRGIPSLAIPGWQPRR